MSEEEKLSVMRNAVAAEQKLRKSKKYLDYRMLGITEAQERYAQARREAVEAGAALARIYNNEQLPVAAE